MSSFSSINAKIGKTIDTIADLASLRAYKPSRIADGDTVLVTSGTTLGDQRGGAFVWVEDSTAPDDGQTTIRPGHAIGMGRWQKMFGKGDTGATGPVSTVPGPVGPKGDPGSATQFVGLFGQIKTLSIPAGTNTVQTDGYSRLGTGGARYTVGAIGAPAVPETRYSTNTANGRPVMLFEGQITFEMFGAKGDGRTLTDAATQSGSNVLTSATANFNIDDIGKIVALHTPWDNSKAGMRGTIIAVINSTQATLDFNAAVSANAQFAMIGSDDLVPMTQAAQYLFARGGGTISLLSRHYHISSALQLYPNTTLQGQGRSSSAIKRIPAADLGQDSATVLRAGYETPGGGQISFRDFTVWGTNWYWLNQGGDQCVSVGNPSSFYADNLEVAYARLFSLSVGYCTGDAQVTNCLIRDGQRDGINISGTTGYVLVDGNSIDRIGDDCIAIHVPTNVYTGVFTPSVRVTNNRCKRALGIKVLGGRNCTITGNQLDLYYGYGIYLGNDVTYGEGICTPYAINVSDNILLNGLPHYIYGSAAVVNSSLYIDVFQSKGTGENAVAVYEGERDPNSSKRNQVVTGGTYLHKAGGVADRRMPIAPQQGVIIKGNIVKTTLDYAVSKFSDYGMGELWFADGPVKPATVSQPLGLVYQLKGLRIAGDTRGYIIADNHFEGCSAAIEFNENLKFDMVKIHDNNVIRCGGGVQILPTDFNRVYDGDIHIYQNSFNLDPFCEAGDRNADGSWSIDNGSDWFGVLTFNTRGVRINSNTFENCRRHFKAENAPVDVSDNTLIWDWSSSSGGAGPNPSRGIAGAIQADFFNARHVTRYANPQQSNYNQFGDGGGMVQYSQTMPTTGWYVPGAFVAASFGAGWSDGRRLKGWLRDTWGNGHVLGTDWRAVYHWDGTHPETTA